MNSLPQPKSAFLTSGWSVGRTKLNAFDGALRRARICDFNLIKVTSILPPQCKVFQLNRSDKPLDGKGNFLPAVYTVYYGNVQGQVISAGVAVGVPNDKSTVGVILAAAGPYSKATTQTELNAMVSEGMNIRGINNFEIIHSICEASVTASTTAVVACFGFCDEALSQKILAIQ